MPTPGSPAAPFDLAAHQRQRIRALERDNAHLEHVRQRLERLLALTLRAAAGNDCNPLVLLAVIERIDELAQKPGASYDELAQLLRDTDPQRVHV